MSDVTPPPTDAPDETGETDDPGLIDRLRGTGVGLEDENIVGDVGPTDVAPGADPDGSGDGDALFAHGDEPGEV
jgi:hypothetical protein